MGRHDLHRHDLRHTAVAMAIANGAHPKGDPSAVRLVRSDLTREPEWPLPLPERSGAVGTSIHPSSEYDGMAAVHVMTGEELIERLRDALPPPESSM